MRAILFKSWLRMRARPLLRHLEGIEKSQWLGAEQARELTVERLRAILEHARDRVPYYRELLGRIGFDPRSVRSVADLAALPPLDRETITERFDDLRASPAPPGTSMNATGGSTGRRLRFLVTEHERMTRSAHLYRNLRWLGWDLGRRAAYVWGSDVDSSEHRGRAARLRDTVSGVLWLDAFSLHESRLDEYLDRIERFAPAVLIGYPSSLHLLARRAIRTGRSVPVGGIQTSAEMLAPGVRDDLRKAFRGAVMDRYGCREAGIAAHECSEGRLHVNSEAVVMECVDDQVLLTTLNNLAMPLIRYRNGDLARLREGGCPCGRGLPLVEGIRGRASDVIVSPGGRLIHGEFFTHLFYNVPGVECFQVRQTAIDRLVISVVAGAEFTGDSRRSLEETVRKHGDPAFAIHWNQVAEISPGPTGKFRFTISDVHRPESP